MDDTNAYRAFKSHFICSELAVNPVNNVTIALIYTSIFKCDFRGSRDGKNSTKWAQALIRSLIFAFSDIGTFSNAVELFRRLFVMEEYGQTFARAPTYMPHPTFWPHRSISAWTVQSGVGLVFRQAQFRNTSCLPSSAVVNQQHIYSYLYCAPTRNDYPTGRLLRFSVAAKNRLATDQPVELHEDKQQNILFYYFTLSTASPRTPTFSSTLL